jgi:Domain of unknown function (DUF6089)
MKLLIIIILFTGNIANAQVVYKKSEYGFGIGGSNYYGDLNQTQSFNYARYSVSVLFKHNFNPYISLKLAANYGKIGGSDGFNKNSFEKLRNLSFENDLFELSFNSEFNFLSYEPGDFDRRWTPYINLGIGVFRHDAYTYLSGKKYYLKPLGTEGQNVAAYSDRKYNNFVPNLITGIGFKFWMKGAMTMGFEAGYRFTNTDYLDDVSTTYVGLANFPDPNPPLPYPFPAKQLQDRSPELGGDVLGQKGRQRGIASNKDQYLFAQIVMSIRLAAYACPR